MKPLDAATFCFSLPTAPEAVADAFDAITTDRPYQKGRSFQEALAILKQGAGTK
jgi:hypothetical protein